MEALTQWSNALAAALFGAVALWQVRRDLSARGNMALVAALVITAGTALVAALVRSNEAISSLTSGDVALSQVRHLAWLGFLYLLWRGNQRDNRSLAVGALYGVIAALFMTLAVAPTLGATVLNGSGMSQPFILVSALIHILSMVGGLVLVHNLYSAGSADAREALRLPLLGIAALWIYDLNLYTIAYLARSWPSELFGLQGLALALTAPLFALSVFQNRSFSFQLSRSVAFQSISLFSIGGYLIAMVMVTYALDMIGGDGARMAQTAFVFAAMMGALMLGPSAKFRAWFRVKVSKHLFQHRYDYRSEWLRFTNTLGRPDQDAAALNVRVVQAVADILESPSGLLLTPDAGGMLLPQAQWNWSLADAPPMAGTASLTHYLSKTGRVIECDSVRDAISSDRFTDEADLVPQWILAEHQIWALVPLVHFDRPAGVVLLTRPIISRTLDWEDFDLLRVVGRQVASYLAEARSQELLSEARRFDEFNRRFAFIMHDIKNLVSQLSLVTRNAERHADNPAFRADMIETLKSSTARMNALLARLSQHNKGKREEPRDLLIADCARKVADLKRSQHPVLVTGDFSLRGTADPARLEQALGHLVQNAIDATMNNEPITIALSSKTPFAQIDVIDLGSGMSAAFIDAQLFKPFMSTKENGFGIGTYEARSDITDMGGRLLVTSREGFGTTFSVCLPLAATARTEIDHARDLAA